MHYLNKLIFTILLIIQYTSGDAQTPESDYNKGVQQQSDYLQQPIQPSTFDTKEWQELKKKVKIKEEQPKPKKEKKEKEHQPFSISPGAAAVIKWSLFALVIGVLLFLVAQLLGINPFNKKAVGDHIQISLEELEENLDTADIDPHLYAAIKAKNYKLAIRLYYLMIIQKLALKEKIYWKKYKTNRHYLNEMRNKQEYPVFKNLTYAYERCWFGEAGITEKEYDLIQPEFVNFLQNIH